MEGCKLFFFLYSYLYTIFNFFYNPYKFNEASVELVCCLYRAPWQLIPFIISMFVMISTLNRFGVADSIASVLGERYAILTYGISSFLASNIATIVGSNLGACFTPIGALAGIMWCSILGKHNLRMGFFDFLKIGIFVAIPTLIATLIGLYVVI